MTIPKTKHTMKITQITKPAGMSDKTFEHMVRVNKMTPEKLEALRLSLERGKELIESSRKLIERRKLS